MLILNSGSRTSRIVIDFDGNQSGNGAERNSLICYVKLQLYTSGSGLKTPISPVKLVDFFLDLLWTLRFMEK